MKHGNSVKDARATNDYWLRVVFHDGYTCEIDLHPLFENPRGPLTTPFQDPAFFAKVYVDVGTAAWPNGYDIDPDVLRYYREAGRVCSQEELAAAFEHPKLSPMTLNEREKQ
jgi:hypothetical protein